MPAVAAVTAVANEYAGVAAGPAADWWHTAPAGFLFRAPFAFIAQVYIPSSW
jgi:hypothetical protein